VMDKESRKSTGVAFVLAVYAASRLFYLISGSLLAYLVPTSSFQRAATSTPLTMSLRPSSPCIHYFSDPLQSSSAVLSQKKPSQCGRP
jgi:hypothetical protein